VNSYHRKFVDFLADLVSIRKFFAFYLNTNHSQGLAWKPCYFVSCYISLQSLRVLTTRLGSGPWCCIEMLWFNTQVCACWVQSVDLLGQLSVVVLLEITHDVIVPGLHLMAFWRRAYFGTTLRVWLTTTRMSLESRSEKQKLSDKCSWDHLAPKPFWCFYVKYFCVTLSTGTHWLVSVLLSFPVIWLLLCFCLSVKRQRSFWYITVLECSWKCTLNGIKYAF